MTRFGAHYYDGKSSRRWDVTVSLEADGMVRVEGLPAPLELRAVELRVAPRLGDVVRSVTLPDGAKLEANDHVALDELATRGGGGPSLDWVHRLESRWLLALGALGIVALVALAGFRWGVPLAARFAASKIPPEQAYSIGQGALEMLDQVMFKPSKLEESRRAALAGRFSELAQERPELPLSLQFRAGLPNAFALPSGTIVVTDELVELSENDEEVLAVLGHEIGHVAERHALRMTFESSLVGLFAFVYFGDVSQISAATSALPAMLANASYSREHEQEADTFALELLRRHQIPTSRFADLLERLEAAAGGGHEGMLEYLSSHPATEARLARFR
jgi:Zn-dependent protease with chaperone function